MSFGIYLHMPFCRRRCPYCDFYKKVPRPGEIEGFPQLLEKELIRRAESAPFSGLAVSSIYFGGGTPSLHPPKDISLILEIIRCLWPVKDEVEVTLEANPGTVDLDELRELRASGINRLSLGLQSFSQRKLRQLFRDHDSSQGRESFQLARKAGFGNISVDLIFGVPSETLQEWKNDLEETVGLEPDHVSLYNLEYHPGTPFYRWRENGKLRPLDEELELEMYLHAHEKFVDAGYEHYEISNFARRGFRSRHNGLYWTGGTYLGVGPSAHSYDGKRERLENRPDFYSWRDALLSGQDPILEREHLTDAQCWLEWLALNLRMVDGVIYEGAIRTFGRERSDALWQMAREMREELIAVSPTSVALTPRGWFCQNEIVVKLYKAFDIQEHRLHRSGL
ncbi:MAG: radical SAM family heme chaperone HemW [bacterium]